MTIQGCLCMWNGRDYLSHNPVLTGEYFPYKRIAYYISNHRIIAKVGDELISWDVINFEVGQSTDERSINVCGGFWFLEEISRIRVGITGIGSSNHSPSEQVWVRILALEVWSAPFAVDVVRVLIHGWKRGGSMVYSLWELVTVSNHVWHAQWIASKNVVHLHQSHYVQLYCYHSTQKHYTSSCFAHLVFLFSSIFSLSVSTWLFATWMSLEGETSMLPQCTTLLERMRLRACTRRRKEMAVGCCMLLPPGLKRSPPVGSICRKLSGGNSLVSMVIILWLWHPRKCQAATGFHVIWTVSMLR